MLNLEIGERTFIAKSVNLALHNKIKIGSRVVINSGAQILTASHRLDDIYWSTYSKPITIEDYAWIATNAIILPGVTIGIGAVVGAGAVVNRDVGAFEIVNGNTAKFVKNRIGDLNYCPVRLCAPYEAWLGKLINL